MHSGSKLHLDVGMQVLFSSTAATEGSAGSNVQAQGVTVTTAHAIPLDGGAGGDVQAPGVSHLHRARLLT